MKTIIGILLLFVAICSSCEKNEDLQNDTSPSIPSTGTVKEVVQLNSKLYLEGIFNDTDTISQIKWMIKEIDRTDSYTFTRVAAALFNDQKLDFSINPLELVSPKEDNMKLGFYTVEITVVDKKGEITTTAYEFEVIEATTVNNETNYFSARGVNYAVNRVQYSLRNVGTQNENVRLQICSNNTSVSSSYLSKGSVAWFNLDIKQADFELLTEKKFSLSDEKNTAYLYLNKNVEGKEELQLEAVTGSITIKKNDTTTKNYIISFEIKEANTDETITGYVSGELTHI